MQYNLKFQRFNSVLLFFSPESWNYAGRSVHGTDPCCFLTCLVLWELCEILLGFPRSLASTEQRKESRTPKALMLRNKHVNTILFVFRGQLRTPYMLGFFFSGNQGHGFGLWTVLVLFWQELSSNVDLKISVGFK